MEALLSICIKEEMRGVIRFLSAEGEKPVEIIRRMQAQYDDNCLSRSKIYEWIDHFKKGRTSVCDEERSGRPAASRTENNIEAVERTVREKQTSHSGRHCGGFKHQPWFKIFHLARHVKLARCKIG
jgi:transposase